MALVGGDSTVSGTGYRNTGRIWCRLLQIIAITLGVFGRAAVRMFFARVLGNQERFNRLFGEALANLAERLGPVFVKLAQMVSYRADILPESMLAPLARLQEHVAPLGPGEPRRMLELALGYPAEEIFTWFDDNPIACGSIASVHRAQMHAGDLVAVKIVRPAAAKIIRRDIACAKWVARRVADCRYAAGLPVRELFEPIANMITSQCDMVEEARNLSNFARAPHVDGHVHVPLPRCAVAIMHDVLIMDYIGNTHSIASPALSEEIFRTATLHVLRRLYRMIFVEGLVHCDLHPGNVHVRADGTACLFDAGLVSFLSLRDRECFREFFLAIATGNTAAATSAILNSALGVPADLDRCQLEADVAELVRNHTGCKAGEFLVVGFVHQLLAVQRRHQLYSAPGYVSAIWALVMFEGLVRHRFKDLDFQGEARAFAITALLHGIRRVVG